MRRTSLGGGQANSANRDQDGAGGNDDKPAALKPSIHPQSHWSKSDPRYVNRPEIERRLDELLPGTEGYYAAALVGMGGIGKTSIARDYASRRRDNSESAIFWVRAEDEASFTQSYRSIAQSFGRSDCLDGEDILRWVRSRVESLSRWVLVLDNADDPSLFEPTQQPQATSLYDLLPRGPGGTILWTTRNPEIERLVGHSRAINVPPLSTEESMSFFESALEKCVGEDELGDARRLLEKLSGLPLAISHVAAYIRRGGHLISEMVRHLEPAESASRKALSRPFRHLEPAESASRKALSRPFQLAFDTIRQNDMASYRMLCVLSFVHPDIIPFDICQQAVSTHMNDSAGHAGLQGGMDHLETNAGGETVIRAISTLLQFSVLDEDRREGDGKDRVFSMHRLIQYNMRSMLRQDPGGREEAHFARVAFRVIDKLFPKPGRGSLSAIGRENWDECEKYLPHGLQTAEWAKSHGDQLGVANLLMRISAYLGEKREWDRKLPIDRMAKELRTAALGAHHPETARAVWSQVISCIELGDYSTAEELLGTQHRAKVRQILQCNHQPISDSGHPQSNPLSAIEREYLSSFDDPGLNNLSLDGANEGDFSDIASVVSECFTQVSDASSQTSFTEDILLATTQLADFILSDKEARDLLESIMTRVGPERFTRNIARFLKSYGHALRKEATNELQHQSANFVRKEARSATIQLKWRLRPEESEPRHREHAANQHESDEFIINWINSRVPFDTRLPDPDEMQGPDDVDVYEASEVPQLTSLELVKSFLAASTAWEGFRSDLRKWLRSDHPPGDVSAPHSRAVSVAEQQDEEVEGLRPPRESGWIERGLAFAKHLRVDVTARVVGFTRALRHPRLAPGYIRISWNSARGRELYMDLKTSDKEAAMAIQKSLGRLGHSRSSGTEASSPSGGGRPQDGDVQATGVGSASLPPSQPTNKTRRSSDPGLRHQTEPAPASTNSARHRNHEKRYLLLCFSVMKVKAYRQIDLTGITNDQMLFEAIHRSYLDVRWNSSWEKWWTQKRAIRLLELFSLFAPKQAEFVQFTLMPIRRQPGPYGIKPGLPPSEEVLQKKNWHYEPCPSEIEHFLIDEAFLTILMDPGHAFEDDAWTLLCPKKLRSEFKYIYRQTGVAWGIHIVDGLNYLAVAGLSFLVFLGSGLLGIVYSVITKDPGAGFTIAAWLASTTALGITTVQLYTVRA